ncbi:nitroreductase family protein [Candidatus Woesearchaeota archaeon]|nr:nitroreductase family protein [Candidatus Woesearchaeota archaeon]
MNLDEVIKKRASIRKYLEKPVTLDKIALLLEAARTAPNSGNLQDFRFVVINNKAIKNQITETSLRQFWMNSAPVFIVVCSDLNKLETYYKERSKEYGLQNASAAAMLISLKAVDLGLSTCWVNVFDKNAISRILRLKDKVIPHIVLTLGYEENNQSKKKFSKIPLSKITFFNSYGTNIINVKVWAKEKYLDKIKKLFTKK